MFYFWVGCWLTVHEITILYNLVIVNVLYVMLKKKKIGRRLKKYHSRQKEKHVRPKSKRPYEVLKKLKEATGQP